jgi:hypothetical protein
MWAFDGTAGSISDDGSGKRLDLFALLQHPEALAQFSGLGKLG